MRIVEYILQLIALNGYGLDTWVVLNSLSNWYRSVNFIKNGKGNILLKAFIRNVKLSERNVFLSVLHLEMEGLILIEV